MNINKILLLLIVFNLLSCKNDKTNDTEVVNAPTIDPKQLFNIDFDLVIKKDDSLQLFYKESNMTDFDGNKMVLVVVKGSEIPQKVNFVLPIDVIPSELRMDLGNNKKQESIKFNNFEIRYLDKKFTAKDTLIYQYFQPNDQITWDRKSATAKPNLKQNVFYDPGMGSRDVLKAEINKLLQ